MSSRSSPSPTRDLRAADPSPPQPLRKPPPRKPATRTGPRKPGPAIPHATEPASANRTPSETADRSASETAATDAAAKAGPDRSTTETTTTYRPAPKAAADCTPAETATHPTAPEPAAHPATVEPTAPTATHSSTTALGRSHVGKESGRDQRCRTEKTKLIHGRLLRLTFCRCLPRDHFKPLDGEPGMNTKGRVRARRDRDDQCRRQPCSR